MDVSIGKVAEIHVVLGVGGVTETVDVVGESPVVDVTSSSTDNTLSQDMLFNLPIRPDNAATGHAQLPPRHQQRLRLRRQRGLRQRASSSTASTPATPTPGSAWVFFNFNLMEEVQVGGLGANAEYGSYTGRGRQHASRSRAATGTPASSTPTGRRASFFGDNITAGVRRPEPVARRARPSSNKRLDITGQLGGPIIKDKLFFFVAAQRFESERQPERAARPRTPR